MVSLSGALTNGRFHGSVAGPSCTTFWATKVSGHPTRARVIARWKGRYNRCAQGPTGLTLIVRALGTTGNRIKAVFKFYALRSNPGVPSGRYTMTGYFFPAGVVLDQSHWISQPPGYVMVNLVGRLPQAGKFTGAIVGCTTFAVHKT